MITDTEFEYQPNENEAERASNSYLMSLLILFAGPPLPIVGVLATLIFYIGNRKASYFVRWHCTQALISQVGMLLVNSSTFWWTIYIIFGSATLTTEYLVCFVTVLVLNIIEFIGTIYTAIKTRKGLHVQWLFYSSLTDLVCARKEENPYRFRT